MSRFRRRDDSRDANRDDNRDDDSPARPANLVAIAEARARQRCTVEGQVVRMRARPTEGVPSLAVSIADGTGSVIAIWTGRRAVGGITLGRRLRVEGVASRVGDTLEFTNPAYTLLP